MEPRDPASENSPHPLQRHQSWRVTTGGIHSFIKHHTDQNSTANALTMKLSLEPQPTNIWCYYKWICFRNLLFRFFSFRACKYKPFLCVDFILQKLPAIIKLFVGAKRFFVASLGFSTYKIMPFVYRDHFINTSFFPIWMPFISFSSLTTLARTSKTMWVEEGKESACS